MCAKPIPRLVAGGSFTYADGVTVSNFIKATALTLCVLGASASAAEARNLTPAEQSVCGSLKACLDIVRRHDASEFDYTTLDVEFKRFGSTGKAALFTLLESDVGHADIGRLISNLGPLTQSNRRRIQSKWSKEKAQAYLPLLLDSHPMSRDLLLQTLEHPNAEVRETVRLALQRFPQAARNAPLPKPVERSLISALQKDPIAEAAPYLARLNPVGHEASLAEFLSGGKGWLVTAAYAALYRKSPAEAFNALLAEMEAMKVPPQSQAVGQMLAIRHRTRKDGFYLKFAREMSDDPKLSVAGRASGLHAILEIAEGPFPALTPERAEALSFLVKSHPFVSQDKYLPYLKKVRADDAMDLIWEIAHKEKWINRDRVAVFFEGHRSAPAITANLIKSNDVRSFNAGLRRAKPSHNVLIQSQINSPVKEVANAARRKLKLRDNQNRRKNCSVHNFDLGDMLSQMPFFESGWMTSDSNARISLTRSHLTTAHPSRSGWLAGYDLRKSNLRSAESGGSLLHYDNKSGEFKVLGDFAGPLAIVPSRPLKLGQMTDRFWVVDQWGGGAADMSAYILDLTAGAERVSHIGALPRTASGFSVSRAGELVISFTDKAQTPIRLSQTGEMVSACLGPQPVNPARAPK